jgi:hypothetical protein
LAGVIVALVVAGCAQVPTSGPIVEVDQPVTDTGTVSFVRVLARPPQPGMSPAEIVQGFLDAASGFEDGHAVAKQYLTDTAARQWNPSVGVRVYGNESEVLTEIDDSTVAMNAIQLGLISDRSQFIQSAPGATLNVTFALEEIAGEFRISRAPQGLLLSRAAVERSYREFETYYVARPGGILAPNPVLFQSSQSDVSTDLVRALVAGPSRWLAPAVINGFPVGTKLLSVTVTDTVALVDFTSEILTADPVARQQLSAQLVWTLRQIAAISGVIITAEGQPFDVPGTQSLQPRSAWADYDPDGLNAQTRYYLVRQGRILSADSTGVVLPTAGAAGAGVPRVAWPLISLDQTAIAATDGLGQVLTTQVESDSRWRDGPAASTRNGSWDRTGLLWLSVDGEVRVVNVLGSRPVAVPLADVTSVQVSRDGSRAVVIASGRPYLMRVDRSTDTPQLEGPRLLTDVIVRSAAWAGATTVSLLTRAADSPAQVATVELGLFTVRYLGGPPRARTVAAAPDKPLLSGTADGQIWAFNGSTWIPALPGRMPRYPG